MFMKKLKNFSINIFVGGAIVLLPIIILFQRGQWLFGIFKETTQPITALLMNKFAFTEPVALIANLVVIFIIFSVIGMIVRTRMGGSLFEFLESKTLSKIPGYNTVKDIIAQVTGKQKGLFRKVAMIKVGETGVVATGFVVDDLGNDYSSVFIPCGPNPTTGFILHLKNSDITEWKVSVETAMKTIIACGSGSSRFIHGDALKIDK